MARRGRKPVTETPEEQLERLQVEIDKTTQSLKSLKAKKKIIEGKIEDEKKEKLYQAVVQSGKSIDDVLAALTMDTE